MFGNLNCGELTPFLLPDLWLQLNRSLKPDFYLRLISLRMPHASLQAFPYNMSPVKRSLLSSALRLYRCLMKKLRRAVGWSISESGHFYTYLINLKGQGIVLHLAYLKILNMFSVWVRIFSKCPLPYMAVGSQTVWCRKIFFTKFVFFSCDVSLNNHSNLLWHLFAAPPRVLGRASLMNSPFHQFCCCCCCCVYHTTTARSNHRSIITLHVF